MTKRVNINLIKELEASLSEVGLNFEEDIWLEVIHSKLQKKLPYENDLCCSLISTILFKSITIYKTSFKRSFVS